MPTPSEVCDAAHNRLKELGWSVSEFATVGPAGTLHSTDAVKGDRRASVHAPTLSHRYQRSNLCGE